MGFDAGLYDRAVHYFTAALELATEAGDAYLQSIALKYAGGIRATLVEYPGEWRPSRPRFRPRRSARFPA